VNCFVTGTDTGVGKTYVSALLIRGLRAAGVDAVGMKPICCGGREDAELLHSASGDAISLNDVNPVWLRTPAAPYTASMIEERMIDLDAIRETFARLRGRHRALIVEGAGGWLVPIRRDFFIADLAAEMDLPVVVVAVNKLGAINHTLLTVRDIHARGLKCAGVIFNNIGSDDLIATTTNRGVLETLLDVPILFEVERNQSELRLSVA
jgi:dethiobiotin synthetase